MAVIGAAVTLAAVPGQLAPLAWVCGFLAQCLEAVVAHLHVSALFAPPLLAACHKTALLDAAWCTMLEGIICTCDSAAQNIKRAPHSFAVRFGHSADAGILPHQKATGISALLAAHA